MSNKVKFENVTEKTKIFSFMRMNSQNSLIKNLRFLLWEKQDIRVSEFILMSKKEFLAIPDIGAGRAEKLVEIQSILIDGLSIDSIEIDSKKLDSSKKVKKSVRKLSIRDRVVEFYNDYKDLSSLSLKDLVGKSQYSQSDLLFAKKTISLSGKSALPLSDFIHMPNLIIHNIFNRNKMGLDYVMKLRNELRIIYSELIKINSHSIFSEVHWNSKHRNVDKKKYRNDLIELLNYVFWKENPTENTVISNLFSDYYSYTEHTKSLKKLLSESNLTMIDFISMSEHDFVKRINLGRNDIENIIFLQEKFVELFIDKEIFIKYSGQDKFKNTVKARINRNICGEAKRKVLSELSFKTVGVSTFAVKAVNDFAFLKGIEPEDLKVIDIFNNSKVSISDHKKMNSIFEMVNDELEDKYEDLNNEKSIIEYLCNNESIVRLSGCISLTLEDMDKMIYQSYMYYISKLTSDECKIFQHYRGLYMPDAKKLDVIGTFDKKIKIERVRQKDIRLKFRFVKTLAFDVSILKDVIKNENSVSKKDFPKTYSIFKDDVKFEKFMKLFLK